MLETTPKHVESLKTLLEENEFYEELNELKHTFPALCRRKLIFGDAGLLSDLKKLHRIFAEREIVDRIHGENLLNDGTLDDFMKELKKAFVKEPIEGQISLMESGIIQM